MRYLTQFLLNKITTISKQAVWKNNLRGRAIKNVISFWKSYLKYE